jgi:hypothetical protein
MDFAMSASILAYLDPGAGSLLLQALVGGGAGLVVFGKYMWDAVCRSLSDRRSAANASK